MAGFDSFRTPLDLPTTLHDRWAPRRNPSTRKNVPPHFRVLASLQETRLLSHKPKPPRLFIGSDGQNRFTVALGKRNRCPCEGAMRRAIAPLGPPVDTPLSAGRARRHPQRVGRRRGSRFPRRGPRFLDTDFPCRGHIQFETGHPLHPKCTFVRRFLTSRFP